MKKSYQLLSLLLVLLVFSTKSFSQNNLAAGDLAIASYQSDFDPTNTFTVGLAEREDRFSLVVLKPGGLAAGTVIYITDRGWNGPANNWLDESYPPFTFGLGHEAVIRWTVPAGGIPQGQEVFFINIYHDELAPGSEFYEWFAYSDEAGTIPLGVCSNETPIVPVVSPEATDGLNLTFSGDNLLVYQTGPVAGPTGGYNATPIRFITAILANLRPTTDPPATDYATWDTGPTRLNESSLPPGLTNGQTCFVMSPGPLPAAVVNGTIEPDNGKFSNCALSSAGTCTALQMSAIIYNIANWTYSNAVFPLGTSSSLCTYTILPTNTITLTSAAGTNNQTVIVNTAITNITYATTGATGATFSGLPAGVTGSWAANVVTISGSPTTAVGSPFNYTVTLTGGCGSVTATGTITVTVPPCTAVDQTVTASPTSVCAGGSSTITVGASQAGVNYTLRIDPANTFVAGPTASNGPAINFPVGPLAATTTYNVLAETDKYSINLNGGQAGFSIPAAAPLDLSNNFTMEGWIKPAGNGSFARMFNKDQSYALGISNNQNSITFTRHNAGDFSVPFTFTNGTWYHIACTYVSGTVEFFVNGVSVGTVGGVPAIVLQLGTGGQIGSDAGGGFNRFNGNIDNVRIWNSVRTPAQISANQAAFLTSTGNPTLVASWWIIEGAGNARDYSANAIHATALAGTWQIDAPVAPCSIVLTTLPTVTVNGNNTITLSSAAGTNAQTACINTPIINITYTTTGATGATVTGLPAGVSGSWAANVVTISGTPTIAGAALTYTVTLTGGCGTVSTTGTITVNPNNTVTLSSAAGTDAQTVVVLNPITNITYATTGATGATFGGLPAGVTGSWAANVVTISGTPTVTGSFNYTVTLTGGCGTATATGNINVVACATNTWTGTSSNNWFTPGNWSCGVVPTAPMNVVIPSSTPNPCVVAAATTAQLRNFTINAGAVFTNNGTVNINGGGVVSNCGTYQGIGTFTGALFSNTCATAFVRPGSSPGCTIFGAGYTNGSGTEVIEIGGTTVCTQYDQLQVVGTATLSGTLDVQLFGGFIPSCGQSFTIMTANTVTGTFATILYPAIPAGLSWNIQYNATSVVLSITGTPTATATPASQTTCSGAAITTIVLSGSPIAATTYNWTRDNVATVTGIAASGSGNISGTLTNLTNIPITVTFTITPVSGSCTGASITATVQVNPTPDVNQPASQVVCNGAPTAAVTFTGSVTAPPGTVFNWTNSAPSIGLAASGTGNIASFTATNATAAPVVATVTVTPSFGSGAQVNLITNGGFESGNITGWTNTPSGGATGWVINNGTLDPAGPGVPTPPISGNFDAVSTQGGPGINLLSSLITLPALLTNCILSWDDRIMNFNNGITAGCTGNPVGYFNPNQQFKVELLTNTLSLITTVYTTNPGDPLLQPGANNRNFNVTAALAAYAGQQVYVRFSQQAQFCFFNVTVDNISLVESSGCLGTPKTFTYTVNPTPTAVATPASQTICSATPITTIAITGNAVAGVVYNWTRDNVATVTGIAASGAGTSIAGTLTNTTNTPVTVTFTITPTANGCAGTPITATVLVNPTPTVNAVPNQVLCNGAATTAVTFTGAVTAPPGTVHNWTNTQPSIGLAASGSGNIASFIATNAGAVPVVATIQVTPSYTNGGTTCNGTPTTFTITVNPTPAVTITANPATGPYCGTGPVLTANSPQCSSGVTYSASFTNGVYTPANCTSWDVFRSQLTGSYNSLTLTSSLGGTHTLSDPATAQNIANAMLAGTPGTWVFGGNTYNVGVGCGPTGVVELYINQGSCNCNTAIAIRPCINNLNWGGVNANNCNAPSQVLTVVFGAAGGGCTYLWNTGATTQSITPAVSGTYTVTVTTAGGCSNTTSYNVIITPVPDVNQPANQVVCNNTATAAVNFTGSVAGTVYNWTNNTTSIGLAASGTGNIPSFTATNTGTAAVVATIIVTPSYTNGGGTCSGTPRSFTITVNPTPTAVATPASQTVCSATAITTIVITGNAVAGVVYNWTRDNTGTVTGIAASGAGNISGTLTNTTNVPITVTFTITPTANGCPGTPTTATVTVNPTPDVNQPANQVVCNGAPTAPVTFTGSVAGTIFNWTNNTPSIGLAASGTGNIASFNAINTGTAPVVATITVTPSTGANGAFYIRDNNPWGQTSNDAAMTAVFGAPNWTAVNYAVNPATVFVPGTRFVFIEGSDGNALAMNAFVTANITTIQNWVSAGGRLFMNAAPNQGGNMNWGFGGVTCVYPSFSSSVTATVPGHPIYVGPFTPVTTAYTGTSFTHASLTGGGLTNLMNGDAPGQVLGSLNWGSGSVMFGTMTTVNWHSPAPQAQNLRQNIISYMNAGGGGSTCTGTPRSFTITVNPTPTATATPSSQTICSGAAITNIALTGTVAGTTFTWTRDNPVVTGIATSGSGTPISGTLTNPTNTPITVTFTITPSYTNAGVTCTGTPITATVVVNPTPTVNAVANQVVCNGAPTTAVVFTGAVTNPPGTVYNWTNNTTSIGLAASGVGNIASFTATNATTAPVTATITVTPSYTNAGVTCTGTPRTFTITVNPTATVIVPANAFVCNGSVQTTGTYNFSTTATGGVTTYNWTNNDISIGLGASGTGNSLPTFTATNPTNVPITGTITVTPTFTNGGVSCVGTPNSFSITVNPTPNATATPASQTICSAGTITTIVNSGTVAGTVFNWTRDNTATATGIAASGSGNISGSLTNTTNGPVLVTFTITPSYTNGGTTCTGSPVTATVLVNPLATVNPVANQMVCNGNMTTAVNFTSPTTGGTIVYNWTNNLTSIGLAASGTGNIAAFTAINTGTAPVTAAITVTPTYTNGGISCVGTSSTFTITVNPSGQVNQPASQVVCNNAPTAPVNFTTTTPGTIFNWTNNTTSIGLAASGTGNIASFIATNPTNAPVVATVTVTPVYVPLTSATATFNFTGAMQTFTVPAGVTSIDITALGAQGGSGAVGGAAVAGGTGGLGASATGTLAVTPGQVLNIFVGGQGATPAGGFNGGGNGGNQNSGGGGGASDVRAGGAGVANRVITAGGGGGGGRGGCDEGAATTGGIGGNGGTGGGGVGANGASSPTSGGLAGGGFGGNAGSVQGAFGAAGIGCGGFLGAPGTATATEIGANGGNGQACCCFSFGSIPGGGGGGGGQIGGGGAGGGSAGTTGCSGNSKGAGGGGGGGSSFTGGVTAGSTANGVQSGNGQVVITYAVPGGTPCPGPSKTFTYTVNPTPTVNPVANQIVCNGAPTTAVNFTGFVPGTVYSWTNNEPFIGLAASGTGNIGSFISNNPGVVPVVATITVTPTYTNGGISCVGTPTTFTITVNPSGQVYQPANQVVCNNAPTAPVNFTTTTPGTIFNWTNNTTSIGLAASGTGNIASFTATNVTNAPVVATVTVTPVYTGGGGPVTGPAFYIRDNNPWGQTSNDAAMTAVFGAPNWSAVNYAVNPATVFVPGTKFVFIEGSDGNAIAMNSFITANITTIQNWVSAGGRLFMNAAPNQGGNMNWGFGGVTCVYPSFSSSVTATVPGHPIYVGPFTPVTTAYTGTSFTHASLTGGGLTNLMNGDAPGQVLGTLNWGSGSVMFGTMTTVNWHSPAPQAQNLRQNIIAFAAASTINCPGPSKTFTITVNPTPTVNAVANQTVCAGTLVTQTFSGSVAGTVYNWTNSNTAIGLGASGSGNLFFTATNASAAPISGTITVTPTYTNGGTTCSGTPITFTITVNPTPDVNQPANQIVCAGSPTAPVNFTGTVPGTVYNWTNSNPSIGLAASGTGNIASFTAINATAFPVVATIVVTPSYTAGGTTCTGASKTFTITVNPIPTVTPVSNKAYCTGATTAIITFSGTPGSTFSWTNDNTAIGLAASGTGDILPFVTTNTTNGPLVATITVTPSAGGCTGTPITFTITVNPRPVVNPVASQIVCNGTPTAVINFTSPTTGPTGALTFTWTNSAPSIGLAANGTGNIPSFIAVNTGLSSIIAIVTVTPVYTNAGITCTGTAQSFTITVNPTPTVNPVTNQVLCVGSSTAAVNFTGSVFGTIYNWTNNNTSIGLAAAGAGNIASFVATNVTNVAQVATITVTPNFTNGVTCPGTPITFTITVNPIPTVNPVANQTVCAGSTVTQVFSGPVAGTVYNWTNSNTAIGLGASGSGNISFTSTNTTGAPLTGTITVTPTYTNGGGSCTGSSVTFTITVNPIPTVNVVLPQVLCNGSNTVAVNFTGAVAGTVYNWTNSNTTIGLAAAGTGNIASFVATNATAVVQIATITVTPTYTNGGVTCTGTPISFTITVNPTPAVNTIANQTVCNGTATTAVTITGPVAGTVYSWTNNNTSIGLAANGNNTVPSFVALNPGSTPVTATITITPTFTNGGISCAGPSSTFTITVNPTAVVNQPADQLLCNGASTAAIVFSGLPPGSTYNWTNSNTAIGLGASGTGNIPSFIATNATAAPITATITVTPISTGCGGTAVSFTITVNPTPSVNAIANQTVCAGSSTAAVTISGPVANTIYTWTNSNTTIGLGASGTGNIPAFVTVNPTIAPVTATITVTPSYTNGGITCTGNPVSFTITVNPLPNIVFPRMPPRVCLTDTIVTLVATPAGGIWSGPGIVGNTFNAALAGLGVSRVTYTVTNAFGCTTSRFENVVVHDCRERHNVFQQAIRIWPNPNQGRFSIQFNSDKYKQFKVKIVNARGQEMAYYEFKNLVYAQILPFDLSRLAAGEYFLYVYNTEESGVFPIVIAR